MKSLLRSLLSLLFLVGLVVGVTAAVLFPVSSQRHLALVRVAERIEPPPPTPADDAADPSAGAASSLSVQHQVVGVEGGQLSVARYGAEDEASFRMNVPDPGGRALTPGLNLRSGPPRQAFTPDGFWSRDGNDAFVLRLPLIWIAVVGLSIAGVGYGSRTLYRLITTERKPSAVCLHCNQRYEDFDASECPTCGAARSRVTVSKIGRPV